MVTPLGTTFSTDEQVVAQGDVACMGRMVELLVVEFDQAKYEEFLSSGSKSPRARQYCKVSSKIRSRVSSEASLNVVCAGSIMAGRIMRNASVKTREASVVDGQIGHTRPLPQLQITGGSQQPVRRNQNVERRQRRRARQLQTQETGTTICPADTKRESQARVSSKLRQMREVCIWRPKCEAQKACVSETSPLKRDNQQHEVRPSSQRHETRLYNKTRDSEGPCCQTQ